MEKFELDKTVIQILSMSNVNHFTAMEIRTAYIALKQDEELNPTISRRFVYEELLKLIISVSTIEINENEPVLKKNISNI